MSFKTLVIYLLIFIPIHNGKCDELKEFFKNKWPLNQNRINMIQKGEVLTDATVVTNGAIQSFSLKAIVLHPKSCNKALRKISMLEMYDDWISFITYSTYNEKNKLFTLKADHVLLPYPMIIHIIVDRPTKAGIYPFSFPTGMFKGLKGFFEISKFNNKCLFYSDANWSGNKTKIPDLVIEIFSETLSRIGGEVLIRKTTY